MEQLSPDGADNRVYKELALSHLKRFSETLGEHREALCKVHDSVRAWETARQEGRDSSPGLFRKTGHGAGILEQRTYSGADYEWWAGIGGSVLSLMITGGADSERDQGLIRLVVAWMSGDADGRKDKDDSDWQDPILAQWGKQE